MTITSHHLLQLEYLIPLDLENNEHACSIFHGIPIHIINKTAIINRIKDLPKTFLEVYASDLDEVKKLRFLVSKKFPNYNVGFIHELSNITNSEYIIQIIFQDTPLPQRDNKKLQITVSTTAVTSFESCVINLNNLSWDTLSKSIRDNLCKIDDSILNEYNRLIASYPKIFQNNFYLESFNAQCDHIFNEEAILENKTHIVIDKSIDPYFFSKPEDIINDLGLTNDNKQDFFNCIKSINSGDKCALTNSFFNNYLLERSYLEALILLQTSAYPQRKTIISSTNKIFIPLVREIGDSVRMSTAKKINRQFGKLAVELNRTLLEFINQITNSPTLNIKFISNIPLEWATDPTSNLPLMIKHNVSRIPSSPGYITNNLLLDSEPVLLRLNDFSEILVISSFADNDPIKNDLRDGITVVLESEKEKKQKIKNIVNTISIHVKFIEVSTAQELIDTLNNNRHSVVIFDLHGSHQKTQPGLLVLKNESVLVFDIIKKTRIPPVVILSACDTSPIDRNHYSTAAGFIMGGAKTVVASALPINSRLAAKFIVRLIIRMEHILPIEVRDKRGEISWGKLILGMLRRTYYSELLNALQKEKKLATNKKYELMFQIGLLLDPPVKNWHSAIQGILLNKLNMTAYDFNKFINNHFQFPQCLRYIQIGNPELVRIVSDAKLV